MRDRPAAWHSRPALRKSAAALVLLLVAALHLLAARRLPVGVFNDDAANVLLARSMSRGSYAFPGGFGAPEEYLPAFPLLLAVPVRLVEPHWNLLRAIPLAFVALCLFLTWRLARRFLSDEAAAAAVLLTALTPVMLTFGGLVVPYMPYLALTLALIDGAAAESRSGFLWLAAGASLAPLLRPQGVVLIGCLALAQWHRRGLKRAAVFLFLALLPAVGWTLRNHLRSGSSRDYVDIWRMCIAAVGNTPLRERAAQFLSTVFGSSFLGFPGTQIVQAVSGAIALAFALFGALRLLKKREDPRVFVLASYVAGLIFLHMTWKWIDPRYLIPFVPLLWILILAALAGLLAGNRALTAALFSILVALPLPFDLSRALLGLRGSAQFEPETIAWIRKNTPAAARLVSRENYSIALLTGRECAPQMPLPHASLWLAQAHAYRIGYFHAMLPRPDAEFGLPGSFPEGYQAAFTRWLGVQPGTARVYQNLDEGAIIYRIGAASGADAGPVNREKL